MTSLQDFYDILHEAGNFLTDDQLNRFDVATYNVLASYAYLADCAMPIGLVRYNIVQKHHVMAHLPAFAKSCCNPRLVATYTEESFIAQGI